ncbi:MAG: SPFH domain-containing protein [Pseudomonadota bacterium]
MELGMGTLVLIALSLFGVVTAFRAVAIVSQSEEYVVERFGRYTNTLKAGVNLLVPYLDRVAHQVVILERQLDPFPISVITKDNVEIVLETTTFFRITDAAKSVYRISDLPLALRTTTESVIRSAAGRLELDEVQSSRQKMNEEILSSLREAAEIWGVEITRSEITDVRVDEATKDAQRQQLLAERQRRATVATAEGERQRVQLEADAQLYEAQKEAEAVRVTADAEAYAVIKNAEAQAQQTKLIADTINAGGEAAINYDIVKRQVDAIGTLGAAENSKTLVLPTNVTETLGAIASLKELVQSDS